MNRELQFVKNHPALKLGDALVIADLHLGKTYEYWQHGFSLPRQAKTFAMRINKLKKKTRTKRLVILGDIKNKIGFASAEETRELPLFFSLLEYGNITAIKGNHDGGIESVLPGKIKAKGSACVGGYMLTHGHMNVSTKKKTIIIGHNQPHVKFVDKVKAAYTEPVWVRGKLGGRYAGKELVMVPAFNELCGATVVNKDRLLGPIAKCLGADAHIFMLDGTDLGTIRDMMID